MEAHFLQLDTSSVKRLLVRRDEESVKVDQVFKTRKEIMKKEIISMKLFLKKPGFPDSSQSFRSRRFVEF